MVVTEPEFHAGIEGSDNKPSEFASAHHPCFGQTALGPTKRIARSFRNFHYFRLAAYHKAGGLNLQTPRLSPTLNVEEPKFKRATGMVAFFIGVASHLSACSPALQDF